MTSEPQAPEPAEDAALFAALRRTWSDADPVPAELVDAMVAAVAAADLEREYALLVLVDSDATAAVRGDADMLTMQFSDGTVSLLLHITRSERGARRLDGWVDGDATAVGLIQEGDERRALSDGGRFAFDDVGPGIARLRVSLTPSGDAPASELLTPRFEI